MTVFTVDTNSFGYLLLAVVVVAFVVRGRPAAKRNKERRAALPTLSQAGKERLARIDRLSHDFMKNKTALWAEFADFSENKKAFSDASDAAYKMYLTENS